MQYLALIYDTENNRSNMSPDEQNQLMADYGTFTEEIKKAGVFIAGEALKPVATATTVRIREGKTLTTDGPFAETKEQLGGFYMLECKDLDEALAWAAKIPTVKLGAIVVRPIMVW